MPHLIVLAAAAMALSGTGPAPPPVSLTQVQWVATPNGQDIADVFPPDAVKAGKSGAVLLDCQVAREGSLEACTVEIEDPVGMEFGAAAMALAPLFKMAVVCQDGTAAAGRHVRIPIMFSLVTNGD